MNSSQEKENNNWEFINNKKIFNTEKLNTEIVRQQLFFGNHPSSIVIIKNEKIVYEYHSFMTLPQSRFDIWSCTKTFTGLAWLMFLEETRQKTNNNKLQIDLNSYVYKFLPKSFIARDKRKKKITLHHLLSMTSGITGESHGIYGLGTDYKDGPFEFALGLCKNRNGKSLDKLSSEPGKTWDYSDAGVAILSILFFTIAGQNIHEYLLEKVFKPLGIKNVSWDFHGGGKFLGPYTSAHIGLHISARDLSRFGLLLLNQGQWKRKQLVSKKVINKLISKSQNLNPNYGYQTWINTNGQRWINLPKNMYALEGYNSNRCYVLPSQKLIVTRLGAGPSEWNEQNFINNIFNSLL